MALGYSALPIVSEKVTGTFPRREEMNEQRSQGQLGGAPRTCRAPGLLIATILIVGSALSCKPTDFVALVHRSRPIAEDIYDPAVVLGAMYDPRVQGPAANGPDDEVLRKALEAAQKELGTFALEVPEKQIRDRLRIARHVGFSAGEDSDWQFCRETETVGIRGRFSLAGQGSLGFTYCSPSLELRSVRFEIPLNNREGVKRLDAFRTSLLKLLKIPRRLPI